MNKAGDNKGAPNVTAILASPHGSGSTAAAVDGVLSGCRDAGALATVVDLLKERANGFAAAVDAVEAADAIVFGSPIYRATHTSLLASFLESLERGAKHETSAPLQGKATAVVMTGVAAEHFLATEKLRGTLASFYGVQVLSPSLFLTQAAFGPNKSLTSDAAEAAALHGGALTDLAVACQSSKHIASLKPLV